MTADSSRFSRSMAWLTRPMRFPTATLVLVAIAFFVIAVRQTTVQGDTWWALRAGRDMWETRQVVRTDTYSFTAYGDPWPDHSWLYQVILYALYVVGKFPLLTIVHALLPTLAIVLVRPRGRVTWADVVAITPVISLISLGMSIRPMVLSLMLLAVMIRLIHAERMRWIVLLMFVWANLHGEVVLGGLMLVAATVVSFLTWVIGRRKRTVEETQQRKRRFRSFVITTAASAAVTLLNPMGWGLWHYILTAPQRPGQEWIAEWQPSWSTPVLTAWFWGWCAVLVVVLLFRWKRLLQWPILLDLSMTLVIAPLAWTSLRNISVFAIISLPLFIRLLRRQDGDPAVRPGSLLPGARVFVAAALVAAAISTTRTLQSPDDLGWTPMSPEVVAAINDCPGQIYTTYNSGAYLIWFTPDRKVFVDNRQDPYSKEIIDLSALTPDMDYRPTFEKYDIRCAAVASTDAPAIITLGALAQWEVVATDGTWVVLHAPEQDAAGAIG